MRWIYKLPRRLQSLFRKRRVEQDLTEELRFHLEKLVEANLASDVWFRGWRSYRAPQALAGPPFWLSPSGHGALGLGSSTGCRPNEKEGIAFQLTFHRGIMIVCCCSRGAGAL